MCGIAGCFVLDMDVTTIARRMADALVHRGPDDAGVWSDHENGIALSHRRLAILDLSPEGHQPMVSADGRYVMAFNGEIYNHQALRKELESEGIIRWRGHSDTEVMLAAISTWGIERALPTFVGMFAIALWDRAEHRLHLIRDRIGEKPLYYGWCKGAFVFGSELKALQQYPGFEVEIDRHALALYLRHMYIPAPFTIYRGIYKLQPGCMLSLDLAGASRPPAPCALRAPFCLKGFHLQQWWSLHETVDTGQAALITDEAEALALLESRLRESIRLQSLADVPVGAFLSGGIDSSLIVALMQSEAKSPVRTFTVGSWEKRYNEANYAGAVARHLGTEHVELYVTAADALDVIQRLPHLYDEPFGDSSQIPTFLVCNQIRKHVTVALSGDAGDELFGGYTRYFLLRSLWNKISWMHLPTRRALAKAITAIPPRRWDAVYASVGHLLPSRQQASLVGDKLHKLAECLATAADDNALFYNLVSEWKFPEAVVIGAAEPVTLLTQRNDWPALPDVENRMMYLDTMTYLPDDILVKVDRAAMGVSLETRVPFLDHRVVELAWRMPLSMKLRHGQGKWALRQILYKYVPPELIERPKQGFGIALGDWLRGPLRKWADDLLAEERLRREGYFYPDPIRAKWLEHLSGARNWEHSLWAVLMFQAWFEELHT
jgi:asparagine synthase (glutamine-hydrolysing)